MNTAGTNTHTHTRAAGVAEADDTYWKPVSVLCACVMFSIAYYLRYLQHTLLSLLSCTAATAAASAPLTSQIKTGSSRGGAQIHTNYKDAEEEPIHKTQNNPLPQFSRSDLVVKKLSWTQATDRKPKRLVASLQKFFIVFLFYFESLFPPPDRILWDNAVVIKMAVCVSLFHPFVTIAIIRRRLLTDRPLTLRLRRPVSTWFTTFARPRHVSGK